MGFSNATESQTLNQWFGGTPPTIPDTYYVALCTAVPTDDSVVEVAAVGYARQAVPNTKEYWSTSVDGSPVSNLTVIPYDQAGENWGPIPGFAIYDQLSGGNEVTHGEFPIVRTVYEGDTAKIGIGKIVIRFIDP